MKNSVKNCTLPYKKVEKLWFLSAFRTSMTYPIPINFISLDRGQRELSETVVNIFKFSGIKKLFKKKCKKQHFFADARYKTYGRTINLCIKFDRVLIKACFISHFKGHQMAFLTRYRTLESVYRNTSYEKVSNFLAYSINQNFCAIYFIEFDRIIIEHCFIPHFKEQEKGFKTTYKTLKSDS